MATAAGETTYAYDAAGRLVTVEKNGTLVEQYAYDANGNRTSGTAGGTTLNGTYDGDDKVTTYGGAAYTHAAGGELKTKVEGGQTTTYTYDAVGNLRTVTLPSGTTLEYVIDGRNRRVGKRVNGVLTKGFLYDGQLRIVAELDGSNNIVGRYVYGTRTNVPEWMEKGGETYRIITDHLGSVRLVVNTANGAIIQRMDYDSWGNITNDTNAGFQPFGYAGGLYDADTKLTRFGARDYDAHTGRWTAKDPIGFNGGDSNVYRYAQSDPINIKDPAGKIAIVDDALGAGLLVFPQVAAGVVLTAVIVWGAVSIYDYWHRAESINPEPASCPLPKRHTPEQEAVVDLAKEAKKRGGVNNRDAETLVGWGQEAGLENSRGPESHPERDFGSNPHIHVGPIDHIPVREE